VQLSLIIQSRPELSLKHRIPMHVPMSTLVHPSFGEDPITGGLGFGLPCFRGTFDAPKSMHPPVPYVIEWGRALDRVLIITTTNKLTRGPPTRATAKALYRTQRRRDAEGSPDIHDPLQLPVSRGPICVFASRSRSSSSHRQVIRYRGCPSVNFFCEPRYLGRERQER